MESKIIVLTCMHRRVGTLKYCFDKMPTLHKAVVYSEPTDRTALDDIDYYCRTHHENEPLSFKWNAGLEMIKQTDFEAVIILGSDDYVDEPFIKFVKKHIKKYDMIGFKDAYYELKGDFYYWGGYEGNRNGEPVGAGRVYSREYLERIDYNLWTIPKNYSLDFISWNRCIETKAKAYITTLKEHGLKMVDVKDGGGMNSLEKLQTYHNLIKL